MSVALVSLGICDDQTAATALPIPRGGRRFASGFGTGTEQHRENNEHLHARRVIRAAEEGRDIKARIACRLPCDSWPNNETVEWIATSIFVGKIAILHFRSGFEPFVLEPDRDYCALSKAPLAAAIKTDFLLEKPIHRPFDSLTKIF